MAVSEWTHACHLEEEVLVPNSRANRLLNRCESLLSDHQGDICLVLSGDLTRSQADVKSAFELGLQSQRDVFVSMKITSM